MKVLKFGGTSMGSAHSIAKVADIIRKEQGKKVIVVSAMSGVTNALVEIDNFLIREQKAAAFRHLADLEQRHLEASGELLDDGRILQRLQQDILEQFEHLKEVTAEPASKVRTAKIITLGERLSSSIISHFLESIDYPNTLLDAKDFMHVPNMENPETERVGELFQSVLKREVASDTYITQGFVRLDRNRDISTLNRGGSDYTATILAAAIHASEVQIWTDIDGFHNNDPRYVENTKPLSYLSFEEAAELAYFGAKVLHPQTVAPVKEKNIPLYLRNTFTPELKGTLIFSEIRDSGLKAISAKDGITAIKIKSNRMLMAHGFLRRIFDVFDQHSTAIDMITTSEIAVSLTIDDDTRLQAILEELEEFGEISVDRSHSIICIVGEGVIQDRNAFRLFEILTEVPVRMISYGGSNNNISLLVATTFKQKTLQLLHDLLFKSSS